MEIYDAMRFQYLARFTWWQKTRLAALLLCAIGVGLIGIFSFSLTDLAQSGRTRLVSIVGFSLLPLVVVTLVAFLARLQERLNVRSGGNSPTKSHKFGDEK